MNNDIKYKVIELLNTLPVCIPNSTKTQYVTRCPYCGDSLNQTHGHFSIKIDTSNDDPIVYRCLKCDESGLFTTNTLEELQLPILPEVYQELRNFNRKIIKKNKFTNTIVQKYVIPVYNTSALNDMKLKYINQRLGLDLLYTDAVGLKVIFDIFEFIKCNDITVIPNISFKYLTLINYNYVGFLSTNNNCIIFRRVTNNQNLKRYIKVILNPSNINSNNFYSIPNSINLLYTDDINIHISEGIFDIMSIFANLNNSNKKNNYYYSACGFGYITILKYLIYNGINTGLTVHIYSDKDKSDRNHIHYLFGKSNISNWLDNIYIHRNMFPDKKDYGFPRECIDDSYYRLK